MQLLRGAAACFTILVTLAGCSRPATPALLPTRAVQGPPPTVVIEPTIPPATPTAAGAASTAAGSATAAPRSAVTLPGAPPLPAPGANAITSATLRDLKPVMQRNEAAPQAIIAIADDRALALLARSFAVFNATDLKLIATTPFTVADAEIYWYTGSGNTRRAAIMEEPGTVTVFDTDNGKTVAELKLGKVISAARADIALTPDGKTLLHVNGSIQLIDIASERATSVGTLPARTTRIVISEDASRVAALAGNELVLISTTGKPAITLTLGVNLPVPGTLALSPDGNRVSLGLDDEDLRVWDLAGATPDKPQLIRSAAVADVTFGPGQELALTDGSDLLFFDFAAGKVRAEATAMSGGSFRNAHYTPDGKGVVTTGTGGLQRIDSASAKTTAQARRTPTTALALHPDGGNALAFSLLQPAPGLSLLDARTGGETRFISTTAPVRFAYFSSTSGKYALAFEEGGASTIWATADWKPALRFEPSRQPTAGLCINAAETDFVRLEGSELLRYPLAGGAPKRTRLSFEPQLVGGCSRNDLALIGRDDKVAVVAADGSTVFDIKPDKPLRTGSARMLISPDGRSVVVATPTELSVWDVATTAVRYTLPTRAIPVAMAFSPTSHRLIVTFPTPRGSRIDVIEPNLGTFNSINVAGGFTSQIVFGPDKDVITALTWFQSPTAATVARSILDYRTSEVTFFDMDSARTLRTLRFDNVISSMELSARGDTLMTGSLNGDLSAWMLGR